ncbi:MAG: hypothetical protein K0R15_1203 [Clostridiales bacterium]|nr:hypothetical protein [Clostridiales bacterium]
MRKTTSDIEDLRHQLHKMLDEDVCKEEIYEMSLRLDKLLEELIDKKSLLDIKK